MPHPNVRCVQISGNHTLTGFGHVRRGTFRPGVGDLSSSKTRGRVARAVRSPLAGAVTGSLGGGERVSHAPYRREGFGRTNIRSPEYAPVVPPGAPTRRAPLTPRGRVSRQVSELGGGGRRVERVLGVEALRRAALTGRGGRGSEGSDHTPRSEGVEAQRPPQARAHPLALLGSNHPGRFAEAPGHHRPPGVGRLGTA